MGKLTVNTIEDNGNNTIVTADGLGDVTVKANTIDAVTGTSSLTLGGTNATSITLGSGASFSNVSGQNYPAFEAYRNVTASLTNASYSKIECDTEIYDTDSCYDNTTNYRFTPTIAGKYFVYGFAGVNTGGNSRLEQNWGVIYKNGDPTIQAQNDYQANPLRIAVANVSGVIDMNGTTDYLELYVFADANAGTPNYLGSSGNYRRTVFGAYRIGA